MKRISLLLALIIALLAGSVAAAPEDHALCRTFTNAQVSLAGRQAVWDSKAYTWQDMPADLGSIPIDMLYTDEEMSSAYYLMYSPSAQELWVFPFWDFEVRADAHGDRMGSHDLCDVMIYDLNPKDRP